MLRESVGNVYPEEDIYAPLHEKLLGTDARIREINSLIGQLADTNLTVLITGETGTGKDIVARLLHKLSSRSGKPFIKVNCPSIPESIFESELFGCERGAFTGAYTSRPGRLELAHEGTIFLDEIAEIPQRVQSKLIQILDGEPFMRIGGTVPLRTSARVLAATNMRLEEAVEQGRLRKDVSYRLREVVIHLPSLRERRRDIPLLAEHFNYNMCKVLKREHRPLNAEILARLQVQYWAGNVRELASRVKEYVATGLPEVLFAREGAGGDGDGAVPRGGEAAEALVPGVGAREAGVESGPGMTPESFPKRGFIPLKEAAKNAAEAAERALIEETLRYTLWNRRKAAKLLKTSYSSLLRRIETYKIGKT